MPPIKAGRPHQQLLGPSTAQIPTRQRMQLVAHAFGPDDTAQIAQLIAQDRHLSDFNESVAPSSMFAGMLRDSPANRDKYDERLINLISNKSGGGTVPGAQLVSLERPITMGKSVHSRIQSFLGNGCDSYGARRVSTAEFGAGRSPNMKSPMKTTRLRIEQTGENTLELRVSEAKVPQTVRCRTQRGARGADSLQPGMKAENTTNNKKAVPQFFDEKNRQNCCRQHVRRDSVAQNDETIRDLKDKITRKFEANWNRQKNRMITQEFMAKFPVYASANRNKNEEHMNKLREDIKEI